MRELVVGDTGEISCALPTRKDDEVPILSSLIVAGNIDFASLVDRRQFFQSVVVADKQHFDRKLWKLR